MIEPVANSEFQRAILESRKYFSCDYSEFIYFRTYSRWIERLRRRETWIETVTRYTDFMKENLGEKLSPQEYAEVHSAILNMRVMPSMRLLWSAGSAAKANNASAYNCGYIAPQSLEDLAEIMYLLMCGVGVGFSVESVFVNQFPSIAYPRKKNAKFKIEDSREGWCEALKFGLRHWYCGQEVSFDFRGIRPAGTRLQTLGGQSSGPEVLKMLLDQVHQLINSSQGKKLQPLQLHDLICHLGSAVMVGGVRRSALISLSNISDREMRDCKRAGFYKKNPQRSVANNSAVYHEKPSATEFLEEWLALAQSGTGERGIFNRGEVIEQVPERRKKILTMDQESVGTNPCGEIILRSKQFCNLSEVVARSDDSESTLIEKIKLATLIGTYQARLTHFPYLSSEWRKNTEHERLLGVSITGQWDCPLLRDEKILLKLKAEALKVQKLYASRLEIAPATAITCVKPSGTVSQLVNASSGLHPRFSKFYLRRIRISELEPLTKVLRQQGFVLIPEKSRETERKGAGRIPRSLIVEFPICSPSEAMVRDNLSVLAQLENWKKWKKHFVEHNPSVTVMVRPSEWISAANWIYENWSQVGGLAFLPFLSTTYENAPYEAVSEQEFLARSKVIPKIDYSLLVEYEREDQTQGGTQVACQGQTCEWDPEEGSFP